MEILKPYCLFLKFGYMRHMFDILKTPNEISATLLKVIPKGLVFLYHYTKAKLFAVEQCVLKKIVSCKRVSGRTVQLVKDC